MSTKSSDQAVVESPSQETPDISTKSTTPSTTASKKPVSKTPRKKPVKKKTTKKPKTPDTAEAIQKLEREDPRLDQTVAEMPADPQSPTTPTGEVVRRGFKQDGNWPHHTNPASWATADAAFRLITEVDPNALIYQVCRTLGALGYSVPHELLMDVWGGHKVEEQAAVILDELFEAPGQPRGHMRERAAMYANVRTVDVPELAGWLMTQAVCSAQFSHPSPRLL